MPLFIEDREDPNPYVPPAPAPVPTAPATPSTTPANPPLTEGEVVVSNQGGGNRPRGGGNQGYPGMNGPVFNLPGAPVFDAPEFVRPTQADAYNEPGYQFRVRAGNEALERSAAARGVLRTGGTLRDIAEYNQNFAAQEYGNVFNRALSAYDRQYQGARDEFAPRLAQWQERSLAERQRALAAYQREWDHYTFSRRGGGGGGFDPGEPPPDPNSFMGSAPSTPAVPTAPPGLPGKDIQQPPQMMSYNGDPYDRLYY